MIATLEDRLQINDDPSKREAVVHISEVQKSTHMKSLHEIISHIDPARTNNAITI